MSETTPEASTSEARRQRPVVDEKKRSQRLFGNILGTLNQFKKEDKSRNASEAAKRREITAKRIEAKIRSETSLHQDIAEHERELKTLRISSETSEFLLSHKQTAFKSRHASLSHVVHFLHTSKPAGVPVTHEGVQIVSNPSPLPLAQGPLRSTAPSTRPLYFLPKVLLPHQETLLTQQRATVDSLIAAEKISLRDEEDTVDKTVSGNRTRMAEVSSKLDELRKSLPPRTATSASAVSSAAAAAGPTASPAAAKDSSAMEVDEPEPVNVKVQGENGDEDVEY